MTVSAAALDSTARRLLHDAACRRLAALLFAPPDENRARELRALADEIADPALIAAARQALSEADPAVYHSTFGPGGPVSLRQVTHSLHVTPGALLAELAIHYEAFGYHPTDGEPPDHIAVETDFTAFVLMKQAYALASGEADRARDFAGAEKNFAGRHLGILSEAVMKDLRLFPIPYMIAAGEWLAEQVGPHMISESPSGTPSQ
ncbi:MAG: hypothetical protein Kow0040_20090 [Thermogutta sp.]